MTTPNIVELDAILAHIEAHPEQWDQSWYFTEAAEPSADWCGTACCIAGFAAARAGWTPVGTLFLSTQVVKDGVTRDVVEVAAEILGLFRVDAHMLFSGNNTLEDLKNFRNELAVQGHISKRGLG